MKPHSFTLAMVFAALCRAGEPNSFAEAQRELMAGRYEHAAALFSALTANDAPPPEAFCGLVTAYLESHHAQDAYKAADDALRRAPGTTCAETASGLTFFRRGDINKAEQHFRAALKIDPNYPAAIVGLSRVYSAVSLTKSAQNLALQAWRLTPDDPDLALIHAGTLKGPARIAAMEQVLAGLDPASGMARSLRAAIASRKALGDRNLNQLTSPYEKSRIKLFKIEVGGAGKRAVGLTVRLNDRENVTLLLDTGASGIAISPKAAERAGLIQTGDQSSDVHGIGDERTPQYWRYLADEIKAGSVVMRSVPVSVFTSARTANEDGLIGPDVFRRFLVTIDFDQMVLDLDPRAGTLPEEEPMDRAPNAAPGFVRIFRFGNHLAIPTLVSGRIATLFLIDTGAASTILDTETAALISTVTKDSSVHLRGVQGRVDQAAITSQFTLAFAGFRQVNPTAIAVNLEKLSDSFGIAFGGILGMPVLRELKITIDYQDGSIRLTRDR